MLTVLACDAAIASEQLLTHALAAGSVVFPATPAPACDVRQAHNLVGRVVGGASAVEALGAPWRRLAEAASGPAAFQTHAFALAAARYHEARGARVRVAVVEREGAVECILPIAVVRRSGIRIGVLLGDPIAQYGDALIARDASPHAVGTALACLRAEPSIDALEFRRIRADAAIGPALAAYGGVDDSAIDAPFADLTRSDSIEALLLGVGGAKQRRERARSRRRLEESGAVRVDVRQGSEASSFLREAVALKKAWLSERGLASAVLDDAAAIEALEQAASDSTRAVTGVAMRLTVDGQPAAYEIGLLCGGRLHAYLGAVAEGYSAFSPGKVLMEEAMRWCLFNGVEVYDLLPSADAYKRHWSTGAVAVRDVVAPITPLGRLYAGLWLTKVRPWLKRQADDAHPIARLALGRLALRAGLR